MFAQRFLNIKKAQQNARKSKSNSVKSKEKDTQVMESFEHDRIQSESLILEYDKTKIGQ